MTTATAALAVFATLETSKANAADITINGRQARAWRASKAETVNVILDGETTRRQIDAVLYDMLVELSAGSAPVVEIPAAANAAPAARSPGNALPASNPNPNPEPDAAPFGPYGSLEDWYKDAEAAHADRWAVQDGFVALEFWAGAAGLPSGEAEALLGREVQAGALERRDDEYRPAPSGAKAPEPGAAPKPAPKAPEGSAKKPAPEDAGAPDGEGKAAATKIEIVGVADSQAPEALRPPCSFGAADGYAWERANARLREWSWTAPKEGVEVVSLKLSFANGDEYEMEYGLRFGPANFRTLGDELRSDLSLAAGYRQPENPEEAEVAKLFADTGDDKRAGAWLSAWEIGE